MAKTPFTAAQFTPTAWDTAADKAKFANQFVRFVESGFKDTLFPKWFYTRLSMTFGHIAHFDRGGFYGTWFRSTRAKLDFLRQTVEWPGYGDPAFTYSDVEKAVAVWVRERKLVDYYLGRLAGETELAERTELARLTAKYHNPDGTLKPLGTVER